MRALFPKRKGGIWESCPTSLLHGTGIFAYMDGENHIGNVSKYFIHGTFWIHIYIYMQYKIYTKDRELINSSMQNNVS